MPILIDLSGKGLPELSAQAGQQQGRAQAITQLRQIESAQRMQKVAIEAHMAELEAKKHSKNVADALTSLSLPGVTKSKGRSKSPNAPVEKGIPSQGPEPANDAAPPIDILNPQPNPQLGDPDYNDFQRRRKEIQDRDNRIREVQDRERNGGTLPDRGGRGRGRAPIPSQPQHFTDSGLSGPPMRPDTRPSAMPDSLPPRAPLGPPLPPPSLPMPSLSKDQETALNYPLDRLKEELDSIQEEMRGPYTDAQRGQIEIARQYAYHASPGAIVDALSQAGSPAAQSAISGLFAPGASPQEIRDRATALMDAQGTENGADGDPMRVPQSVIQAMYTEARKRDEMRARFAEVHHRVGQAIADLIDQRGYAYAVEQSAKKGLMTQDEIDEWLTNEEAKLHTNSTIQ